MDRRAIDSLGGRIEHFLSPLNVPNHPQDANLRLGSANPAQPSLVSQFGRATSTRTTNICLHEQTSAHKCT